MASLPDFRRVDQNCTEGVCLLQNAAEALEASMLGITTWSFSWLHRMGQGQTLYNLISSEDALRSLEDRWLQLGIC